MSTRYLLAFAAAALLSSTAVVAQTSGQAASPTEQPDETPITLVGCLQRESDYRRQHDLGRGGAVATGLGLGNEYVLINASRAGSSNAAIDCATAATNEAYELTGDQEHNLEPFVGRVVQITGMLKEADTEPAPVGTSGTTASKPTGGFDPLGQDLRLQEVNVTSFNEVTASAPVQSTPAERGRIAPEEPIGTRNQEAATQQSRELPRTASPLPLAGLLGLLSIGAALGVRGLRRR